MLSITKIFEFEACHHLPQHLGACHNLHGHSYKLEVTVTGNVHRKNMYKGDSRVEVIPDPEFGMIMDFKNLKEIVESVVGKLDHSCLNDHFDNPTAETMVYDIAHDIMKQLPREVALVSCKLWETSTSYAEFNPFMQNIVKQLDTLRCPL